MRTKLGIVLLLVGLSGVLFPDAYYRLSPTASPVRQHQNRMQEQLLCEVCGKPPFRDVSDKASRSEATLRREAAQAAPWPENGRVFTCAEHLGYANVAVPGRLTQSRIRYLARHGNNRWLTGLRNAHFGMLAAGLLLLAAHWAFPPRVLGKPLAAGEKLACTVIAVMRSLDRTQIKVSVPDGRELRDGMRVVVDGGSLRGFARSARRIGFVESPGKDGARRVEWWLESGNVRFHALPPGTRLLLSPEDHPGPLWPFYGAPADGVCARCGHRGPCHEGFHAHGELLSRHREYLDLTRRKTTETYRILGWRLYPFCETCVGWRHRVVAGGRRAVAAIAWGAIAGVAGLLILLDWNSISGAYENAMVGLACTAILAFFGWLYLSFSNVPAKLAMKAGIRDFGKAFKHWSLGDYYSLSQPSRSGEG